MSREATLDARWLTEHQPLSNQPLGWGFHSLRGSIDPGDLRLRLRVVGVVEIWKSS